MRIAFVNPPRISRQRAIEAEDCCWGAGPLVLPAMLLQCMTEADTSGHATQFVDLAIDGADALAEWKPDLVVHALAWQWWEPVNRAMADACGPDMPRLALAVPPGYALRYLLGESPPFAVAYSEPEAVIAGLPLDTRDLETWREDAPGVAYLTKYNTLRRNAPQPNYVDRMGLISYGRFVPARYWQHYSACVYQVARGCPYRCGFCVWGGSTVTDRTYKIKAPDHVALDLFFLRQASREHAGRAIPLYLLAPQLTTGTWAEQFVETLRKWGHESLRPFQTNVNFADLTAEKLALLKEAGLASCAAGLDGASDGVLQKMGKPYDMEKAIAGLLAMQEAGLLKRTRVRYGMGETDEDVRNAIGWLDWIKVAGVKRMRVNFAPVVHYEGTEAHRDAAADGRPYELEPLPDGGPERLVQKDAPDWSRYVAYLRKMRWLGRVGPRK